VNMLRIMLVTVFGLGFLRPAPGTWGSLPPVIVALGLLTLTSKHWPIDVAMALIAIVFTVCCIVLGPFSERFFQTSDPRQVVADETAGQAIALLFLPWDAGHWRWNLALAALAFVAFRAFDVLKPPPADAAQRLPAGWGIVVDDLLAGLYALILVTLVVRVALPQVMDVPLG